MAEVTDDRWFIDLRGQVKPITSYQILQGLISGELKVINRISRDRQNWQAICNETFFDAYIEQVTKSMMAEITRYGVEKSTQTDMEKSGFHNLGNMKSAINEQLEHATRLQELNVALNSLRRAAADITAKRKLVIDLNASHEIEDLHPDDQNEIINTATLMSQLKKKWPWPWKGGSLKTRVAAVLVAIAIVAVGTGKYMQNQRDKAAADLADKGRKLIEAQMAGQYDKAVALYASIGQTENVDPKALMAAAESQIKIKNLDGGADALKRLLNISNNPTERAQAQSMLGNIALTKNDLGSAASYYREALKAQNLYAALFNLAAVYMKQGDYPSAEPILLQALAIDGHEKGPVLLQLFETAWRLDAKDLAIAKPDAAKYYRLNKVKTLLDQATAAGDLFSDQLLATTIVITAIESKIDEFNFLVNGWLLHDPRQSPRDLKPEPDLYYDNTTWAHIYGWCVEAYKNPNLNYLKSAFLAGCVVRADTALKAVPYAQYAFENAPDNLTLRSYVGLLYFLSDNFVTAKKILRGGNYDLSPLAQSILNEACVKLPDADCGKPSTAKVVETKSTATPKKRTRKN